MAISSTCSCAVVGEVALCDVQRSSAATSSDQPTAVGCRDVGCERTAEGSDRAVAPHSPTGMSVAAREQAACFNCAGDEQHCFSPDGCSDIVDQDECEKGGTNGNGEGDLAGCSWDWRLGDTGECIVDEDFDCCNGLEAGVNRWAGPMIPLARIPLAPIMRVAGSPDWQPW